MEEWKYWKVTLELSWMSGATCCDAEVVMLLHARSSGHAIALAKERIDEMRDHRIEDANAVGELWPCEDGDWVKCKDHLAALAERDEAIADLRDKLIAVGNDAQGFLRRAIAAEEALAERDARIRELGAELMESERKRNNQSQTILNVSDALKNAGCDHVPPFTPAIKAIAKRADEAEARLAAFAAFADEKGEPRKARGGGQ